MASRSSKTPRRRSARPWTASQPGRFGRWGAFSFYPSKTLGCFGDAGALVTDDDELAEEVRARRNHGAGPDKTIAVDCALWGTNARMDNLHAAILLDKIGWYDEAIGCRRDIARRYHEGLADIAALDLPDPPGADPSRFDIFQNYDVGCDDRDELRTHLAAQGIGAILHWGGLGLHRFHNLGLSGSLPRTDRFLDRTLLLPMNHLLRDDQVLAVISAVRVVLLMDAAVLDRVIRASLRCAFAATSSACAISAAARTSAPACRSLTSRPSCTARSCNMIRRGRIGGTGTASSCPRAMPPRAFTPCLRSAAFSPRLPSARLLSQRVAPVRACQRQRRAGRRIFYRVTRSRPRRRRRHGVPAPAARRPATHVRAARRRRVRRRLGVGSGTVRSAPQARPTVCHRRLQQAAEPWAGR